MSLIMGQIESEHLELFAIEYEKIAESDFVYTLASTNIDQSTRNLVKMYYTLASTNTDHSTPNLVIMYVTILRSQLSLIMDLISPELSYLPLNSKICHI